MTVRMPIALYRVASNAARKRGVSLNALMVESLEARKREEELSELCRGFSKLGADRKSCEVKYATRAQREVLRRHG